MIISFDYDDVLAAFQDGWIDYNRTNYGLKLKYEDFTEFDYSAIMKIPVDEIYRRVYEFYETDYFKNLRPVTNSIEVVKQLAREHELYVLTSRSQEVKEESDRWLEKYFPGMFQEVLFTGQFARDGFNKQVSKSDMCLKYGIQLHIEDAPMHVAALTERGIRVVVLETPWNRQYDFSGSLIHRIKSMLELPAIIGK
ncbi:hypothetical protein IT418_02245 [bacterium]|nr:hypothetical protein [bacterium]